MTDSLEHRVSVLEREIAAIKMRTDSLDADFQSLPGLINPQFRFVDTQFARLRTEVADLKSHSGDRFNAVLRALAEALAERHRQD